MKWRNVDLEAAVAASAVLAPFRPDKVRRADLEKLYSDTAAVLAENGPYAMFLYLWARSKKAKKGQPDPAGMTMRGGYELLVKLELVSGGEPFSAESAMKGIAEMSGDFDRLMLARQLLMQLTAYLRYHAKTVERQKLMAKERSASQ